VTKPPAAEKFIHIQLEQMSARSEHHRFEEICFRVTRHRINSNVKLATGPFSATRKTGRSTLTQIVKPEREVQGVLGRVAVVGLREAFPRVSTTSAP
jgi:hypothetical protein